jgi:hypothetical protein
MLDIEPSCAYVALQDAVALASDPARGKQVMIWSGLASFVIRRVTTVATGMLADAIWMVTGLLVARTTSGVR